MKIIDKLAWIEIQNRKILSTRSRGKDIFYIPGGKRELGESDSEALIREIKEELTVDLEEKSLNFVGKFEAQAHGHDQGILVKMTCYSGAYTGELNPDSEIEETAWLGMNDLHRISPVDKIIFAHLADKGEID